MSDRRSILTLLLFSRQLTVARCLSFALLNGNSAFFDPVQLGFEARCQANNVTCYFRTDNGTCTERRESLFQEFLDLGVSGIATAGPGAPCSKNSTAMQELFEQTPVPIVTFDSDVPDSVRIANVGTDNSFLGRTMARLLRQLRPEGGTFVIVAPKEGRTEGFYEEITKYNDQDDRAHWFEVDANFSVCDVCTDYLELMEKYALLNPTAMITMKQTPMRHPNWTQFVDRHRHRRITYIGADGADYQLDYLHRRYVDGLVGQLPYDMGLKSFDVLMEYHQMDSVKKTFYPTNIVAYNLIPLELPPLDVNENLLGNRKYIGFVSFGLVALTAIGCVIWTVLHRSYSVVRAAQPFFLIMVAIGVLIMSSSLIPLSFDDGGDPDSNSETFKRGICMSIPWLAFTGFTIIFSALFSKTWRVNRLFHAKTTHARVKVSEMDVLGPFAILLTCNFAILIAWTIEDPLTYLRHENEGTDYWNRILSTYGACQSEDAIPYLVPLAVINFGVVCLACWQAIQARNVASEFSESKYIGLTVASLFQAFVTGVPIVVVVKDLPQAYYIVLTVIFFMLCMVVLLLIFLPKMTMHHSYAKQSESVQRKMLSRRIQESQESIKWSSTNDASACVVKKVSNEGASEYDKSRDFETFTCTNNTSTSREEKQVVSDSLYASSENQTDNNDEQFYNAIEEYADGSSS